MQENIKEIIEKFCESKEYENLRQILSENVVISKEGKKIVEALFSQINQKEG